MIVFGERLSEFYRLQVSKLSVPLWKALCIQHWSAGRWKRGGRFDSWLVDWMFCILQVGYYPLVNCHITMENHHF